MINRRDIVVPVYADTPGRFLRTASGHPFPILGRAAWGLLNLSVVDRQIFWADTVPKGYNAIEIPIPMCDSAVSPNGPKTSAGDYPFTKRLDGQSWNGSITYTDINNEAPDFTQPNEPFWAFVDVLLTECQLRNLLVMMFPAYVGYAAGNGNSGWMREMVANGATRMQTYGAWIATRYRTYPNVVWLLGGDYGSGSNSGTFTSSQLAVESALITGLTSVAPVKLMAAQWSDPTNGTDAPTVGPLMTLSGAYSSRDSAGVAVQGRGRSAYGYSPTQPAFLIEEPYDEDGPDGGNTNPYSTQPVRRYQWWGWLSSIGG